MDLFAPKIKIIYMTPYFMDLRAFDQSEGELTGFIFYEKNHIL